MFILHFFAEQPNSLALPTKTTCILSFLKVLNFFVLPGGRLDQRHRHDAECRGFCLSYIIYFGGGQLKWVASQDFEMGTQHNNTISDIPTVPGKYYGPAGMGKSQGGPRRNGL